LKSIDYNVAVTFILNNNNNNDILITYDHFWCELAQVVCVARAWNCLLLG